MMANGLSEAEARRRLAAVGPNRLVAVEHWGCLLEPTSCGSSSSSTRSRPSSSRRRLIRSLVSGGVLTVAAAWAYAAHLDEGVEYARSLGVAVLIAGSLLLVWVERAADRLVWSVPLPRTWRFWSVWGGVALSLPLFMHVPAIAGVLRIVPLRASDWALVAAVSLVSVGWRVVPRTRGLTEG